MSEARAATHVLARAMLVAIYRERGGYEGFRSWIGEQPHADAGFEPHAIARMIGYPADFGADGFVELTAGEAVAMAEFFVGDDMVHPGKQPISADTSEVITRAITALGPDARFFSNGFWHRPPLLSPPKAEGWRASSMVSQALSNATFDGGLIGFNGPCAFIFWVEQED